MKKLCKYFFKLIISASIIVLISFISFGCNYPTPQNHWEPFTKKYAINEFLQQPINNIRVDLSSYIFPAIDSPYHTSFYNNTECYQYSYTGYKETTDGNLEVHYDFEPIIDENSIPHQRYLHYVTLEDSAIKYYNYHNVVHNNDFTFPSNYYNFEIINLTKWGQYNNWRSYEIAMTVISITNSGLLISYYKFFYNVNYGLGSNMEESYYYEYFQDNNYLDKTLHSMYTKNPNNHCPFEDYHDLSNLPNPTSPN